jgi:Uma2 family endonuclease
MVTMTVSPGLPFGRPLTIEDLASMPDDGHRYELLDGTLLVSPAPSLPHQDVLFAIARLLHSACPPEFHVVLAPFAVTFGTRDTELQPDVLVARHSDLTRRNLPAAPALAVEVRSPSTALVDLNLKKAAYERFGVESYWIVDPDEPSLITFELVDGAFAEVTRLGPDDAFDFSRPFPIRVSMRNLR